MDHQKRTTPSQNIGSSAVPRGNTQGGSGRTAATAIFRHGEGTMPTHGQSPGPHYTPGNPPAPLSFMMQRWLQQDTSEEPFHGLGRACPQNNQQGKDTPDGASKKDDIAGQ
ncbi:hypothetical protein NLU13_4812 [Sarocladium strictum]|uniref:Uncharacterized protein n=1 Tax=Sarocladium strictum TaxID=5046 RepID=A0AA39GLA8_SARSR|nr:hypothetical protein NLU13_4812 [Sarocladium strictum]